MILAFVISAYVTWAMVTVGYCCGWIDERLLGNVDRRLFKIKARPSTFWNPLLERVVLILRFVLFAPKSTTFPTVAEIACSDQQIVTGITILIAGYAKRSSITVYHWQTVTYLAWMSSGTHLITLSVLRIYLREAPKLRIWRICGMLILCAMLFVAIVPTGGNTWNNLLSPFGDGGSSVPAACFWNRKFWGGWRWDGAFTYILLISNYAARAGALFESDESFFKQYLHYRPLAIIGAALDKTVENLIDNASGAAGLRRKCLYHTLLMAYCTVSAILDMYVCSAPVKSHSCRVVGIATSFTLFVSLRL